MWLAVAAGRAASCSSCTVDTATSLCWGSWVAKLWSLEVDTKHGLSESKSTQNQHKTRGVKKGMFCEAKGTPLDTKTISRECLAEFQICSLMAAGLQTNAFVRQRVPPATQNTGFGDPMNSCLSPRGLNTKHGLSESKSTQNKGCRSRSRHKRRVVGVEVDTNQWLSESKSTHYRGCRSRSRHKQGLSESKSTQNMGCGSRSRHKTRVGS
jgi:hypothetical protein